MEIKRSTVGTLKFD